MESLTKKYYTTVENNYPNAVYKRLDWESNEKFSAYYIDSVKSKEFQNQTKEHYQNYFEILYVTSGEVEVTVNHELFTVKSGDMLIIIPGDVHFYKAKGNSKMLLIGADQEFLFTTLITSIDLQYKIPYGLQKKHYSRHFDSFTLDETNIGQLIYGVYTEATKKEPFYRLAVRNNISRIILFTLRFWSSVSSRITSEAADEGLIMPKLSVVINEINNNYYKNLTASDMANLAGMSYSYFSRNFKKTVGENFSEYLNRIRINEGKKLLSETDMPIGAIAEKVGFTNTSYFISQFKKITDTTPRKFRADSQSKPKNK